jgi:hypothetical protein
MPDPLSGRTVKLSAFFVAVGAWYAYLFYPGVMDWDSDSIHKMAQDGNYTDWFPPLFVLLWEITGSLWPNPGAIWILQTSLLLAGLFLLAHSMLRLGRPWLSLALGMVALTPGFAYLFHEATKDTFLGAALVCFLGTVAHLLTTKRIHQITAVVLVICIAVVCLVARHNAALAVLPLMCVAFYALVGRRRAVPIALLAFIAISLTIAVFVQRGVAPRSTAPVTSLIIFDLAGIAKRTEVGAVHLVSDENALEEVQRCYTPREWDAFAREGCQVLGGNVVHDYNASPTGMISRWLGIVILHPVAYAKHRLSHFSSLLRVSGLARDEVGISIWKAEHNPPNAKVRTHTAATAYERLAIHLFHAVRPWVVLILTALMLVYALQVLRKQGASEPIALLVLAASSSSLAYTMGYLVVGVASDFRYVYWLYLSSMCAGVLTVGLITDRRKHGRVAAMNSAEHAAQGAATLQDRSRPVKALNSNSVSEVCGTGAIGRAIINTRRRATRLMGN